MFFGHLSWWRVMWSTTPLVVHMGKEVMLYMTSKGSSFPEVPSYIDEFKWMQLGPSKQGSS